MHHRAIVSATLALLCFAAYAFIPLQADEPKKADPAPAAAEAKPLLVIVTPQGATALPGFKAKVVDTTGAGDCFVGALAARISAGADLLDAARYANAAASCSVERLGAAPSMPSPREVAARLARA